MKTQKELLAETLETLKREALEKGNIFYLKELKNTSNTVVTDKKEIELLPLDENKNDRYAEFTWIKGISR